jgi:VanZ family protein
VRLSARRSARRRLWTAAAVGWALLVALLLAAPVGALVGHHRFHLPEWLEARADKVAHGGLFFVTAFFFHRARSGSERGSGDLVLALVLAVAYGGLTEIAQLWVPTRTADWLDFVADALGAGCYGSLTWLSCRSYPPAAAGR